MIDFISGLPEQQLKTSSGRRISFVEMIPVVEDIGNSTLAEIARAHVMMNEIAPSMTADQQFVDVPAVFLKETGYSIGTLHDVCFGALSKWLAVEREVTAGRSPLVALQRCWFSSTAANQKDVEAVLTALSGDRADFVRRFAGRLLEDITPFREKPLFATASGDLLPMDLTLVADAAFAFPFWTVHRAVPAGLQQFWGSVFERYVSQMITSCSRAHVNEVTLNPRFCSDGAEVCDVLIQYGSALLLIETKGTMFSAKSKYSGHVELFFTDFETKFVRNQKGERKGIAQLRNSVVRILNGEQIMPPVSVSPERIYPLVVVLDRVADNLLFSRMLNYYCDTCRLSTPATRVAPALGLSIESFEFIAAHASDVPVAVLLNDWLNFDPKLMSNYLMVESEVTRFLGERRNPFVTANFENVTAAIAERLFPGAVRKRLE